MKCLKLLVKDTDTEVVLDLTVTLPKGLLNKALQNGDGCFVSFSGFENLKNGNCYVGNESIRVQHLAQVLNAVHMQNKNKIRAKRDTNKKIRKRR